MKMRILKAATILTAVISILTYAPLPVHVTVQTSAQTAVTSTTLSAALTKTSFTPSLTSGTGVAVGSYIYVDKELMFITNATTTTAPRVQRGAGGTAATTHASGAVVYVGLPSAFYDVDVSGSCTSSNESFLPHINPLTGNIFNCFNSTWQVTRRGGINSYFPTILSQTYTASGAIDIQPGIVFINGTTLAMTLANPTTDQNGMIMIIESTNASAQTVTYTAGFNGGTTARDVATYGGAVGDNMVIFANAGIWWVISTRNVTLG